MVYSALSEYADGTFEAGTRIWGLESGATGLADSGGYLDEHWDQLEDLKARIISGEIVVPCVPDDRQAVAEQLGLDPAYCRAST